MYGTTEAESISGTEVFSPLRRRRAARLLLALYRFSRPARDTELAGAVDWATCTTRVYLELLQDLGLVVRGFARRGSSLTEAAHLLLLPYVSLPAPVTDQQRIALISMALPDPPEQAGLPAIEARSSPQVLETEPVEASGANPADSPA